MNPRERILAAIRHQEPTGVPVDLGATPSSGISVLAYSRLKQHLGLQMGHTRVYDVVQQLAQPEDWFLDRFRIDALDIAIIQVDHPYFAGLIDRETMRINIHAVDARFKNTVIRITHNSIRIGNQSDPNISIRSDRHAFGRIL